MVALPIVRLEVDRVERTVDVFVALVVHFTASGEMRRKFVKVCFRLTNTKVAFSVDS